VFANIDMEVVVSDVDGMDVPRTLIVVNDEQAGKFDNCKLQNDAFKVDDGNGDIVFTLSSMDSIRLVVQLDTSVLRIRLEL